MTEPYSMTQPSSQLLLDKVPAMCASILQPGLGGKGTQESMGKAVLKAKVGLNVLQDPLGVWEQLPRQWCSTWGRVLPTAEFITQGGTVSYFSLSFKNGN